MRKTLLALLAAVLLSAPVAHAQEAVVYDSGPYFLGQVGAYGAEDTQQFNGYELGSEVSAHFVLGYKLNPMWSIQGDLGYFGTSGSNEYHFHAMPLTMAVRLGLPFGAFEPYILGGGGAYFCKTQMNGGTEPIDEVVMGGYLGLGAMFHFANKMIAGGELRYQFMDIYSRTAPNSGIEALFSVGFQY